MQAPQNVDTSKLPGSIRRDGGRSIAAVRPRPPRSPFLPKSTRLDSARLARHVAGLQAQGHLDANESAMFLRALLYVMPQAFEYKYPEIKYANLFPVNYSVPTGAKSHAFHQFDEVGNAQLMDSYADDAPNAERVGYEIIGQIFAIRSEYSYTIQDLRSMMFSNIPLDAMKAVTARRIIERKCDALAAVGDAKHGFTGIANDANATTVTAANKAANSNKQWGILSGSTLAYNATANEILLDCTTLLDGVFIPTKGTHTPNTLVFGTQNWAVINTLRLDGFNMRTVADYLLSALPWIDSLQYWPQLDTAATNGSERLMALELNRENFEIIISQEFEQFPPQPQNLAFKVPCHKRYGGLQMRFPKSLAYMDQTVTP